MVLPGAVCPVTVIHVEPSAQSAAALGNVSAKWVSPVLHVIDAKMDITTLMRMAACPASAIIGLPVVMPSQVLVSVARITAKGITVKNAQKDFIRVLMARKNVFAALVQQ